MKTLNRKRWVKFCIVGAVGTIPNYIVYSIFQGVRINMVLPVNIGWVLGILAGMTSNYILNEFWTWV
jgi:putative flippase GtrA